MKKVMMLRSRENCAKPGSPKAADERWLSQLLPGNEQLYGQHCTCWGDFLRKGRNKKNDEKSKYYSNKSFDL